MEIFSRVQGNVTIVSIYGELDIATAPIAQAKLESIVKSGHKNLVIDLSGLEGITSTGLAVIAHTLKLLREQGGALRLANPKGIVKEVFDIWLGSLKEEAIRVYDSIQQAVRSFGAVESN